MTIYEKADELLHKSDFMSLLNKYGDAFVVGSYRTKIMTWNDLDFYIDNSKFSPSQYYDLAGEILKRMIPTRFDGFLNVEQGAAFLGFETAIYGERWNIDIWWKHREEIESALLSEDKLVQQLKERPECKKAILEIKEELSRLRLYGFDKKKKHYHSKEIYDSVLFGNVLSAEQFLLAQEP